jgi:uncharacterized protein (TIGR01777 family)
LSVSNKVERCPSNQQRTTDNGQRTTDNGQRTTDNKMKILISGASGLVGSALVSQLKSEHRILSLVRNEPRNENEVQWNPEKEIKEIEKLEGVETVIHLAGENVGDGRWTEEKKRRIRDSRVIGTKVLCDGLLKLTQPPKTFICASAIGYYGNRGDEILTEESKSGEDFLGKTCVEWEEASNVLKEKNIRVVHARFGIILSKNGGALGKMLMPFKLGIGGKLGDGKQYFSWIAIDDVISAIEFLISNESISGAVNLTSPNPVTNAQFTATLGKTLSRPTFFTVPRFALKLAFGEMADVALLASQRVMPKRLQDAGFKFKFPELEAALRHIV